MSMPDFINTVQFVANMVEPPSDDKHRLYLADLWLTPATVADFSESEFASLPSDQGMRLHQAVDRFRKVAEASEKESATPKQIAEAKSAFETIFAVVKPYADPDSEKVRMAIWKAWSDEHAQDWIPTFDYQLSDDSTGDPAVWIWLILNDDVDVEADATHEKLNRLRLRIRKELQEAGIMRWPFTHVRTRSEVKELMARTTA